MIDSSKIIILWDIDGTILDTHGAGVEPLERAISNHLGTSVTFNQAEMAGKTDFEIIDTVISRATKAQEHPIDFEDILDSYVEGLEEALIKKPAKQLGDVEKTLLALKNESKFEIGILSGNCSRGGNLKLQSVNLSIFFDEKSKFFASKRLQTRIDLVNDVLNKFQDIIIIGDTPNDIEAARKFGLPIISVATGKFNTESLERLNNGMVLEKNWTYTEFKRKLNSTI